MARIDLERPAKFLARLGQLALAVKLMSYKETIEWVEIASRRQRLSPIALGRGRIVPD